MEEVLWFVVTILALAIIGFIMYVLNIKKDNGLFGRFDK